MLVLGIFFLAFDFLRSVREADGVLERNNYGGGSRTEELEVMVQGEAERIPIEIEIAEQQYTAEEVKE